MSQDMEEDSFDTHIPNLDFFANYGDYSCLNSIPSKAVMFAVMLHVSQYINYFIN